MKNLKLSQAKFRSAFTLIEVMVAVMIVSIVILALLKMFSDNTHIFNTLKKESKLNQFSSLLMGNEDYGFEDKNIYLYDLTKDFDLEYKLRRELKELKSKVIYKELKTIDLSEQDGSEENSADSGIVFEIGQSILQSGDSSVSLIRLRVP